MARLTDKQGDEKKRKPFSVKTSSPAQSKNSAPLHHDIPKFDLAEQILAEQRKLSSVKRKGPGKREKSPAPRKAEPSHRLIEEPPICPEQEKIIADIVTRDINNLLKGDSENG